MPTDTHAETSASRSGSPAIEPSLLNERSRRGGGGSGKCANPLGCRYGRCSGNAVADAVGVAESAETPPGRGGARQAGGGRRWDGKRRFTAYFEAGWRRGCPPQPTLYKAFSGLSHCVHHLSRRCQSLGNVIRWRHEVDHARPAHRARLPSSRTPSSRRGPPATINSARSSRKVAATRGAETRAATRRTSAAPRRTAVDDQRSQRQHGTQGGGISTAKDDDRDKKVDKVEAPKEFAARPLPAVERAP